MPTYDFKCVGCGRTVEEYYPMSAVPVHLKCRKCGLNMERQIGAGMPPIDKSTENPYRGK
jgi:putative FmdB family regulatory protein